MKSTKARWLISALSLGLIFSLLTGNPTLASMQNSPDEDVSVAGEWSGDDQTNFEAVLSQFTTQSAITTSYEVITTSAYERLIDCTVEGNCPDIALISDPVLVKILADQGSLVNLNTIVTGFNTCYSPTWRTLGSVNGNLYAVPFRAMSKSLIWYRPQALSGIGAATPGTWTTLLTLSNNLVTAGQIPFSIGAESGYATGWPLTDWFENILLRVAGAETHRQLARHDIPWTHPSVVLAMQRFRDILGEEDYQRGGINGTLTTNFIDALEWLYGPSPTAAMYTGASFTQGIIENLYPGKTPLTDYNFFAFPEINAAYGKPVMGAADFAIVFNNTADSRALIQFLADDESAEVWAPVGGYLSPNSCVNINSYPDALSRAAAQNLSGANEFVFDLDDQLPALLQAELWGMLVYFGEHQSEMMELLQYIEIRATLQQGPIHAAYLPLVSK